MTANEFKDNVRLAASLGGISKEEFTRLQSDYDRFGFLQMYALRSWMASDFPELSQTVGRGTYELYKSAGGA